jgi:hypothetical protein
MPHGIIPNVHLDKMRSEQAYDGLVNPPRMGSNPKADGSLRATKEDDSIASFQEVPAASRGVSTQYFGRRQQVSHDFRKVVVRGKHALRFTHRGTGGTFEFR